MDQAPAILLQRLDLPPQVPRQRVQTRPPFVKIRRDPPLLGEGWEQDRHAVQCSLCQTEDFNATYASPYLASPCIGLKKIGKILGIFRETSLGNQRMIPRIHHFIRIVQNAISNASQILRRIGKYDIAFCQTRIRMILGQFFRHETNKRRVKVHTCILLGMNLSVTNDSHAILNKVGLRDVQAFGVRKEILEPNVMPPARDVVNPFICSGMAHRW